MATRWTRPHARRTWTEGDDSPGYRRPTVSCQRKRREPLACEPSASPFVQTRLSRLLLCRLYPLELPFALD